MVFLDADSVNLKISGYLSFKLIRNSKKVVGECRLGEEEEERKGKRFYTTIFFFERSWSYAGKARTLSAPNKQPYMFKNKTKNQFSL